MTEARRNLELQSTLRADGVVELALAAVPTPQPGADEIVVEMLGAPINPSDMSLLVALADSATAERVERDGHMVTQLRVPPPLVSVQQARVGEALPIGNEGAGRVVAAGSDPVAQALLGQNVAIWGGGTYARYKKVRAADSLLLPDGVAASAGAAAFINPLTALGMIETMRAEGFSALAHTAAASNLGQMLCRLCQAEGIALVNIVRTPDQARQLRALGAEHVCDSSAPTFADDLVAALRATGAALAFDAVGGKLPGQILAAMETALRPPVEHYSLYGSRIMKKVYVYGGLDPSPIEFRRSFGTAWGMGGWLLFPFLEQIGERRAAQLKARVARELTTIFASRYSHVVSLEDVCDPEVLRAVTRRATGAKYLIDASR